MAEDILQKEWQTFEDKVVPKDANDIQRSEIRMAFFSGMVVVAGLTVKATHKHSLVGDILAKGEEYARGGEVLDIYIKNRDMK